MSMRGYAQTLTIHGAARVDHTTPAFLWAVGCFGGTITDTGAGDLSHALGADYAIDATQELPLLTSDATVTTTFFAFGWNSVSDTSKRVSVAVDDGTPALGDSNYFMMLWKRNP